MHIYRMASNKSMLLFGVGDGGGGPQISHLEQLQRLKNCEEMPYIRTDITPDMFFDSIAKDFSRCQSDSGYPPPPVWVGELYLELHQGTLTSQVSKRI
jgi:alpha-mannosidase